MKLTNPWFEAHFYGFVTATGWRHEHENGSPLDFAESQGVALWCPCGVNARDEHGELRYPLDLSLNKCRPHLVVVPFANPPCGIAVTENHGPFSRAGKTHPRWTVSGSGLHDLSVSPSIAVGDTPECWHGYITNGEVTPA